MKITDLKIPCWIAHDNFSEFVFIEKQNNTQYLGIAIGYDSGGYFVRDPQLDKDSFIGLYGKNYHVTIPTIEQKQDILRWVLEGEEF